MRKSPRDRRLAADHAALLRLQNESSIFSFSVHGREEQKYHFHFRGKGLYQAESGQIRTAKEHRVVVELGAAYPRMAPNLLWQTPIFHPNISVAGIVCLGGYGTHWVPSLTLDRLAEMLWDMIRYQNYDTESPFNREAAVWARQESNIRFPVDKRPLRDNIAKASNGAGLSRSTDSKATIARHGQPANADAVSHDTVFCEVEVVGQRAETSDDIIFLD